MEIDTKSRSRNMKSISWYKEKKVGTLYANGKNHFIKFSHEKQELSMDKKNIRINPAKTKEF